MSFRKASVAVVTALAMTSAPALAAADSASRLSVASQSRAGTTVEDQSQLGGGFIIPLLALAAIVAGILVVIDNDDDPESP